MKINNWKNVALVLSVSLLLLLIMGCIDNATSLPDSFTIRLYGEGGSSGGLTGSFEETLVFEDNNLVSGIVQSVASTREGKTYPFECVLDTNTNSWINNSKNLCYNVRSDIMSDADFWSGYPVYTKSMLEELIRAPKNVEHISPSDQCGHGETCYEIT